MANAVEVILAAPKKLLGERLLKPCSDRIYSFIRSYSSGFRDLGGSRWGMVGLLQLCVRGTDITIPHNVNIDLF